MNANLLTMAEVMRRETGITVKPPQLPSLEAAMRRVEPTMTVNEFVLAITDGGAGAPLLERMIDEFTIKETFFFRQRLDFDAIDWPSLVDHARASGSPVARVWVAATASGSAQPTIHSSHGAPSKRTLTPRGVSPWTATKIFSPWPRTVATVATPGTRIPTLNPTPIPVQPWASSSTSTPRSADSGTRRSP